MNNKEKGKEKPANFNIGKSKKGLDITMNDLKQGNPNFHTLGGKNTGKGKAKPGVLPHMNVENVELDAQQRVDYNNNITNFDKLYTDFTPFGGIILRTFVREIAFSKTGLLKGQGIFGYDLIQVQAPHAKTYVKKTIVSPFQFQAKAVVVSVPDLEQKIKPGMLVGYAPVVSKAPIPGNEKILDYDHSFVHPNSGLLSPPHEINDRHYGYLLVPRTRLYGLIEKEPLNFTINELKTSD